MSECRQPISGRLPPHVEGPAGRFADMLRTHDGSLDEVTQARMERAVLVRMQARAGRDIAGASGSQPALQKAPRRRSKWRMRLAYSALVATAATAGALLVLMVDKPSPVVVSGGGAQFELYLPDGAVQRGPVAEGQTLESGRHSRIQVAIDRSRIELDRRSRVRFSRLTPAVVELSLSIGRMEVGFHPRVRGEQGMIVETRAARVRVVGTRFTVDVDGHGNTRVRVSEGEVEVQPRYGGPAHAVRAGEDLEVMADPGDESERAVRDALAKNLSELQAKTALAHAQPAAGPASRDEEHPPAASEPVSEARPLHLSAVRVRAPLPPLVAAPTAAEILEAAREQLREGQHASARDELHELATDADHAPEHRAEAWTLIAESYTAQGYVPRAREAYRAASAVAPELGVGHNALFALARLLDRYTQDQQAAVVAYEEYLRQVPEGALAAQARHALCRLGGYPEYCGQP